MGQSGFDLTRNGQPMMSREDIEKHRKISYLMGQVGMTLGKQEKAQIMESPKFLLSEEVIPAT